MSYLGVSASLPDFPWDKLTPFADKAKEHEGGLVDLSVGTPVDPTPDVVQEALRAAADSPGYPLTIGTTQLRQACVDWLARSHGVTGLGIDAVLPVIGSKELIASLPLHLGVGPDDLVVYPALAYPTYEVSAKLVGAKVLAADDLTSLPGARIAWVNSPSNPSGRVLSKDELRAIVAWARKTNTLLISDECYIECVWEGESALSILHPDVCDGDVTGLLAVHSLSKRSNLAGYRCAFVAGDPAVVGELLAVRKNLGLQMPGPQQVAMVAALSDDAHAKDQWARYLERRGKLQVALTAAGFTIDHSEASLYLWASRGENCWDTVAWLAERGILVAPGEFYGVAGANHVRVALTATDERVDQAVSRLAV